ncbi:Sterol 3-beta-glucosyltransferase [Psilocybe cubensis]|uniref:Sterol 3-beta-glucosyltransferase n=2 Tax=Psilocybe cubensis TaxID=181762 RepID=A0ACB8HG90_PSICU|nr:Sterol 3-beta-glucosyltransferase [Psilocybe cubensis]KAH9486672.1 Sterol 3-beta-glucosyltransferase [Psilocybe cubensis]
MAPQIPPPQTPTPIASDSSTVRPHPTVQQPAEASEPRPPKESHSRVKRLSSVVEKTVDKLSRSVSANSSTYNSPSSSSKRMFSISRKSRTLRQPSSDADSTSSSSASKPKHIPNEDSPFIRPPSPPLRPSLTDSFRGDGSMRAGTQTLIQALQALPWMNSDNEEDSTNEQVSADSDSDDERPNVDRLSSSIHTIHRPLARSHRTKQHVTSNLSDVHASSQEETLEASEEDLENDFEETPRPTDDVPSHLRSLSNAQTMSGSSSPFNAMKDRTGSMATVRLHRRARLAEKLKEIYELDDIKEVWAGPDIEIGVTQQEGSKDKTLDQTLHRFFDTRASSKDPYFPHGIIDLRYAISCDPVGEKGFRLRTNSRTIVLSADSVPSREEWVKAIRKVIFKAQNMGDSVKIAIPYSAILDVERSTAMDFSETIEVKVIDKEDNFAIDSYFFAYFHNLPAGLEQIRDALRSYRSFNPPESGHLPAVMDTTVHRTPQSPDRLSVTPASTIDSPSKASLSGFRLSSIFRPFSEPTTSRIVSSPVATDSQVDDYTHISRKNDSGSFIPITSSPEPIISRHGGASPPLHSTRSLPPPDHTYPPSTSSSAIYPNHSSLNRESSSSSWAVGVPSWLKAPKRVFGSAGGTDSAAAVNPTPVKEVYSSSYVSSPGPLSRSSGFDMAFSVLETPEMLPDQETTDKFRTAFAYDEKETLLGYFPGYIYRLLPVPGKLYISTNYFCFKSSGPLAARTRMTLPLRDILASEKSKATRFGHHGLIIIVKGHEELFFEFNAEDKRDTFINLLERQLEDVRNRQISGGPPLRSSGERDALLLEEFDAKQSSNVDVDSMPPTDSMADSLPAVMFTSASSTFLTFKPKKSLHFTFLTIGSRGDVQPYIALSKGLMADGHRCRIATHGEFREWIESHNIEFGYVGGDPAELMRICIENGTFTVSFLKEGLLKFRGWLDDLLKTSWEACQGTDVLVESPSAMGGYHIAEALAIPYFRAFTMTWTRTRAYPHAFAVPERKMGGSYNYMSYVMFDQVFWRAQAGQINRWRRNLLHLGPTSLDKMEPHKIPFLYNFSPHVVPPPLDWPEWIRVTGYWFLDDADVSAKKWTPPTSLVQFLDNAQKTGHKVVYIGFGSIVVPDPKAMTHSVIEAVLRSGVHAVLSKGWSDRLQMKSGEASEPEEPYPPEIYPISSIPHDWLFQRIDAACHHGGAGTTGASLRAGIPTIIRPFFGDQFFWADRVEALGVGSGVRKLTVSTLSDALISATSDAKQIARAKLVGEQIRSEDGVATAMESIYRDLEYARSLIKRQTPEEALEEGAAEESTVRNIDNVSPSSLSSSAGSVQGAPSEDWSVISDQEDKRSSLGSYHSENQSAQRTSLAAAVLSVLPHSFPPGSTQQ